MRLHRQPREELSINLTPMIDVVFLLLIFFMVSTQFNREQTMNIKLPSAHTKDKIQTQYEPPFILILQADGQLLYEGKPYSRDTLGVLLRSFKTSETRPLLIKADAKTPHQFVIHVMDTARLAGIHQLQLATQEPVKE